MRVFFLALILLIFCAHSHGQNRGIQGKPAPKWSVSDWYQLPGGAQSLNPSDFKGKVLYLYFFQSWCPGCHRSGFPTLKKMTEHFAKDPNVAFVTIQTTFEGHATNNVSKLKEMADRYQLSIPFGQSKGTSGTPDIMRQYRTGGTPWTVIIDKKGRVRFNDYHLSSSKAISTIKALAGES